MTIKIGERLRSLRKNTDTTQERLAEHLGVTAQAISRWESETCYPDIETLPALADFFGVSVDELLRDEYSDSESLESVLAKIKNYFVHTPENECFDVAYKISTLLHEGAISKGYKNSLPWNVNKTRKTDDDFYKWGTSICSEPEGVTVHKGNTVLISSQKQDRELMGNDVMSLCSAIDKYADFDRLVVFFALYELTRRDFDLFVGADKIGEKCKFSEDKILEIFKWLPIHHKQLDDGSFGYRIEGSNMHLPALLSLFLPTR
ncbi:MAG: helix-turn-helix domain-containing protein [Oscillospiraceae bacterium]|jgi:transcriptional regulator with XRE-family HTH domain|nr:helix-turn-helix domain-containing protein [Oscillospiraceae bacterium]